ncbi:hypothetical protein LOR96_017455 (plasmid) [Yersinia ruckeri]|nr:hypothetical protein [Yersinia ruckeri]UZY03234.1 hypothetical protein LOR96_017455 [Yersinia ruckeri]
MKNIMPPVNTPDNVFHDGNPATGEKGTVVPGLWLTNVQDTIINTQQELASVLSAAGIAIDEAKKNQLATAISKLITDGGFLKTANNLSEIKAAGQAAVAQRLCRIKAYSCNMLFLFTMFSDHVSHSKRLLSSALSRRYYCSGCPLVSGLLTEFTQPGRDDGRARYCC